MKYYVSEAAFKRGNMVLHNGPKCPIITKAKNIVEKQSSDLVDKTYRYCSYCFG